MIFFFTKNPHLKYFFPFFFLEGGGGRGEGEKELE